MKRVLMPLLLVVAPAVPGLAHAQTGSVILNINVANASTKEPQAIPVKVYLPKEATPKDVKDLGGLTLDYDPDTGTYYVHGEVALEAGACSKKTGGREDE